MRPTRSTALTPSTCPQADGMDTRWISLLPGLFGILASSASIAQDTSPINAERPGFSSSPFVLAPSSLQIEAGYQFTDGDAADVHTLPLALLRYGLAERFELQLSWAGINRIDSGAGSDTGSSDLGIGIKYQLRGDAASVPMALFAGLSLPTGDRGFGSDSVDPTVGLFWSHAARLDWFGTVTLSESDGDTTFSNALGIALPINERSSGYLEYVAQFPGGGSSHLLNGGVTLMPQYNLQWDLHAGLGLDDDAPDLFIGAGVAYRF